MIRPRNVSNTPASYLPNVCKRGFGCRVRLVIKQGVDRGNGLLFGTVRQTSHDALARYELAAVVF